MQHIDITVILSHGGDQVSPFVVLKPTILGEPRKNFLGFRFNTGNSTKAGVVFGDVHGADFASPVIDVLEQVAVQALEIIKRIWRRIKIDFVGGYRGQFAFSLR